MGLGTSRHIGEDWKQHNLRHQSPWRPSKDHFLSGHSGLRGPELPISLLLHPPRRRPLEQSAERVKRYDLDRVAIVSLDWSTDCLRLYVEHTAFYCTK